MPPNPPAFRRRLAWAAALLAVLAGAALYVWARNRGGAPTIAGAASSPPRPATAAGPAAQAGRVPPGQHRPAVPSLSGNPTPSETRAERLARLRPALAAGQPIKGALVVYADGRAQSQDVAFVMGQETRWTVNATLTYSVTPTLQDDGTVKYVIRAEDTLVPGRPPTVQELPWVIGTPWEDFSFDDGQHTVGFAPDAGAP